MKKKHAHIDGGGCNKLATCSLYHFPLREWPRSENRFWKKQFGSPYLPFFSFFIFEHFSQKKWKENTRTSMVAAVTSLLRDCFFIFHFERGLVLKIISKSIRLVRLFPIFFHFLFSSTSDWRNGKKTRAHQWWRLWQARHVFAFLFSITRVASFWKLFLKMFFLGAFSPIFFILHFRALLTKEMDKEHAHFNGGDCNKLATCSLFIFHYESGLVLKTVFDNFVLVRISPFLIQGHLLSLCAFRRAKRLSAMPRISATPPSWSSSNKPTPASWMVGNRETESARANTMIVIGTHTHMKAAWQRHEYPTSLSWAKRHTARSSWIWVRVVDQKIFLSYIHLKNISIRNTNSSTNSNSNSNKKINPNDTKANAAGRSGNARALRKTSKYWRTRDLRTNRQGSI